MPVPVVIADPENVPDRHVVTTIGDIRPGEAAEAGVVAPGCIKGECIIADGRVLVAFDVARERSRPDGRVAVALGVAKERATPDSDVVNTGGIGAERISADCGFEPAMLFSSA